MVKISVELVFENESLFEDFREASEVAGLSQEQYVLKLIERNLAEANGVVDQADWLDVS